MVEGQRISNELNTIGLKQHFIGSWILLVSLTWASLLMGCRQTGSGAGASDKILAQVGDKVLDRSEVAGIVPKGTSNADSATLVARYVDAWVRKQLLLKRAAEEGIDNAEIDKKVEEYRNTLVLYEFEKQYVRQHLDTNVSHAEIEAYYRSNAGNFELKQNIVQADLVVLPRNAPQLEPMQKLVRAAKPQPPAELTAYCRQYATFYSLQDSVWQPLDDLLKNTPFRTVPNRVQFLQKNYFTETADDAHVYWVRIKDYRLANQPAPLSFAAGQIAAILINKRKMALMQTLEKKMYEEARSRQQVKIYTN